MGTQHSILLQLFRKWCTRYNTLLKLYHNAVTICIGSVCKILIKLWCNYLLRSLRWCVLTLHSLQTLLGMVNSFEQLEKNGDLKCRPSAEKIGKPQNGTHLTSQLRAPDVRFVVAPDSLRLDLMAHSLEIVGSSSGEEGFLEFC